MKSVEEVQQELIDEFGIFDDWMDKYSYIIEQGNAMEPIDDKYKTENNLVKGCQSRVWLQPEIREGRLHFLAESDAVIVKGLVTLVLRVLNDRTPDEILDADLHFVKDIGLADHLSPTRSNGLYSVIKQIRYYALAYKTKQQSGEA